MGAVARAIAQPQMDRERVRDLGGDVFEVYGNVPINGIGEADFNLVFPVGFFERPVFTYGYSLDEHQEFSYDSFPKGVATVAEWTMVRRGETGAPLYVGAYVLAVIEGLSGQQGSLGYRFVGGALVGTQTAVPAWTGQ